jgi:hypothetical protein
MISLLLGCLFFRPLRNRAGDELNFIRLLKKIMCNIEQMKAVYTMVRIAYLEFRLIKTCFILFLALLIHALLPYDSLFSLLIRKVETNREFIKNMTKKGVQQSMAAKVNN